MARFKDRITAARELLPKLQKYKNDSNTIVAGLPRGGMVTAGEIAKDLNLPLSFVVVKKVSAPSDPELAIGAVTDNGGIYLDEDLISEMSIDPDYIESEVERKKEEARQRLELFGSRGLSQFTDKTVILVDDGIATGSTMMAAIRSVKRHGARKIVVASPTGGCESVGSFRKEADEIICLNEKLDFSSVGEYYDEFPEVMDDEVIKILKDAKNRFGN